MRQIEIYSTQQCPFCIRAKALLQTKGINYQEIDVSNDPTMMQRMVDRAGQRSVPQIFIDGESLGGFDQLAQLNATGGLD